MLLSTSYFMILLAASLSRAAVIVAPPPSPTSISQAGPQADLALDNEPPTSGPSQDPQQQQQQQQQQPTQVTSSNQQTGDMSPAQQHQHQQQQQQTMMMSNSIGTAHSSQMVPPPTSGGGGSPPMSPMGGQQPLRLPRINIYASRSEVKKLLGIDTSINYVTNGQLNTYPLGFTIPMGYHLSDMIFTWQNLGPTNVNYSISLVIDNTEAVDPPLINITRSGLIPHHEQVFKITLPCSGRLTDEVDAQVLINITGLVPVAPASNGQLVEGESAAATQQASAELARAVQQQTELLAAAQANSSTGQNSAEQMQADQANGKLGAGVQPKQPQMRLVSHTIAIKRKKICTQHPVPVQPALRPNEVRPPNQLPASYVPPSAPLQQANDANKWPSANSALDQQSTTTTTSTSNYQPQVPTPAPLAEPAHQPAWSAVGGSSTTQDPSSTPSGNLEGDKSSLLPPIQQQQQQPMKLASSTGAIGRHPINKQQPSADPNHNWPMSRLHIQHHQQTTASSSATNQQRQVQDSAGPNPLIELLQHQHQHQQPAGNTQQQAQQPGANPLLSLLVVMSLIISIALVALLILGSTSAQVGPSYRRHPMDKLSALTNCIWRRTTAGSRAVNKCTKNVGPITIKNGIIGTFAGPTSTTIRPSHVTGAGPKSTVSSLSGLSTISGLNSKQNHHQAQASFSNSLIGGSPYYYKQQQQQHANYTTGPYYHHYQHLPDLLMGGGGPTGNTTTTNSFSPQTSTTSPYHITMSNNQMTKLFLASPGQQSHLGQQHATGAFSVDNNYMPIANNSSLVCPPPTQDSDYQTIY